MKNIIEKSKLDFKKVQNRQKVVDIVSTKGFIRYFAYRNVLPFGSDLLFLVFDTANIFIILWLLGFTASSGGVLGYALTIFIGGMWNTLIYSLREKLLQLQTQKKTDLISHYFISTASWGLIVWAFLTVLFIYYFRQRSFDAELIFISKLLSSGFSLYSSLYFFAAYSVTRIYIPFWIMISNRLLFLIFPIFMFKHIGVWAFATAFMLERFFDLVVTVKYTDRVLEIRGLKLIPEHFTHYLFKKPFWFLLEAPRTFILRSISILFSNLQRPMFILLVARYYGAYILDFFAFYQLLHIFYLASLRISRSLYHDVTKLLHTGRLYLMRILCNYNILISIFTSALAVYIFHLMATTVVPHRFFSLIVELIMMNKWGQIYLLLFFSSITIIIQRVLLLSEAYISLLTSILVFDYLVLGYLIISDNTLFIYDNPLLIFSIQGTISPYYFLFILLIYISGIWKKESIIYKNSESSLITDDQTSFIKKAKQKNEKDPFIIILFLSKGNHRTHAINGIIDVAKDLGDILSVNRFSNSSLFILIDNKNKLDHDKFKINAVSTLGIYSEKVVVAEPRKLKEELIRMLDNKKTNMNTTIANYILNSTFTLKNDEYDQNMELEELIKKMGLDYKTYTPGSLLTKGGRKLATSLVYMFYSQNQSF